MKKVFIFWGREAELSRLYALSLNAEIFQVYYKKLANVKALVFWRYLLQLIKTWLILAKNKPDIIIVQNPPVFAVLAVYVYCLFSKANFVIDSHTAAFLDGKWRFFNFLFRFLARRAILNTCHNYKNLEILKAWGLKPSLVSPFAFPDYSNYKLSEPLQNNFLEKKLLESKKQIVIVNRFASDDDWKTVLKTAKLMPEANFFITGQASKKDLRYIRKNKTDNFILTNYLCHEEFIKLMERCDIVLCLTRRPDTKLWSIQEALSLEKVFITSDSEVLRHYFFSIAPLAKSDGEDLLNKILYAQAHREELKRKIQEFNIEKKQEYKNEIENIKNIINENK